jgi:hypothetical protein
LLYVEIAIDDEMGVLIQLEIRFEDNEIVMSCEFLHYACTQEILLLE